MNSNCGGGLVNHICDAIAEGLTTEAELEARVTRSLTLLMDAGLFDPLELQARLGRTNTHTQAHTHARTHTRTHTHTHTYTHSLTHARTHTHANTHTHICT